MKNWCDFDISKIFENSAILGHETQMNSPTSIRNLPLLGLLFTDKGYCYGCSTIVRGGDGI